MIDWRALLKAPAQTQNTQNEQNTEGAEDFADIADSAYRERAKEHAPPVYRTRTADDLSKPDQFSSAVNQGPTPPLQHGWLVIYRDGRGRLCGGMEDRRRGTVTAMDYSVSGWTVTVADGTRFPLSIVRSVAKTDGRGNVVAAWTVRAHGADGMN
jgi:hypothetical protein